jgi:hypothetical protein
MRPSGPRRRLPLALSSRFRVSISSAVLPKIAPFAITSFRVPARVKANCQQSYGLAIRARDLDVYERCDAYLQNIVARPSL